MELFDLVDERLGVDRSVGIAELQPLADVEHPDRTAVVGRHIV